MDNEALHGLCASHALGRFFMKRGSVFSFFFIWYTSQWYLIMEVVHIFSSLVIVKTDYDFIKSCEFWSTVKGHPIHLHSGPLSLRVSHLSFVPKAGHPIHLDSLWNRGREVFPPSKGKLLCAVLPIMELALATLPHQKILDFVSFKGEKENINNI